MGKTALIGIVVGAASLVISLFAIPQVNALFFPPNSDVKFYLSVEDSKSHFSDDEFRITWRPGEGDIPITFTVTIKNSGSAKAANLDFSLRDSPRSNGWFNFHNWDYVEGMRPEDSSSALAEIPEIGSGEQTVIDYYVTFSPAAFDEVRNDNPQLIFTLDYDGAAQPLEKTYSVTMP